MQSTI